MADTKPRRSRIEVGKELVEVVSTGGSPHEYLKSIGYLNAVQAWHEIKAACKKDAPDVYEKLVQPGQKPARQPERKPEPEKAPEPVKRVPLNYDGYTVRCIDGVMGKYYWDNERNILYWTTSDGEEVSMSPEGWKKFATEELPKAMAILGVEA